MTSAQKGWVKICGLIIRDDKMSQVNRFLGSCIADSQIDNRAKNNKYVT